MSPAPTPRPWRGDAGRRATARLVLAVALVARLAAAGAAAASVQDQYIGRTVAEVRVTSGGVEVTDQRLGPLIEVREGSPLSAAAVRQSIVHLMGLGRYQDVRVDATDTPAGVRVVFDLVPLRDVKRVAFRGDLGLPEDQLRAAVVERFGPTPSIGRAADIAGVLENLYHDHGYLGARVKPAALGEAGGTEDLVFEVAAGPQARIAKLEVIGTPPELLAGLPGRVQAREGDPYEPLALRKRAADYVDQMRRGGYYEARIDVAARPNEAQDAVTLTLALERGPVVNVEFRGDPLPAKDRPDLVPIAREGSADEDLLEDSQRRIEAYLHGQGYRDARVTFTRTEADGALRIVFSVQDGPLFRVASVELAGAASIDAAGLRPLLKMAAGQPFVQAALDGDVAALTAEYQRRGFVAAKVTPTVGVQPTIAAAGERLVDVRLDVEEGVRTLIGGVALVGNQIVPSSRLMPLLGATTGRPFYPAIVEADKDRLLVEYLNLGYRMATVDSAVTLSADRSQADIRFTIHEGPEVLVDHILVVGNERVSEATIRREIVLEPGKPLGLGEVNESQRRLAALGLFRRVTISELQHGNEGARDVLVTVEEAPSTTIGYGGGVEFQKVETSEFAPRGFFEFGRRNLWGKNRSISFYSRVSVRRRGDGIASSTSADPGSTTPVPYAYTRTEYRVVGAYREPRFLSRQAALQATVLFEQGSRTSFSFRRRSGRLELTRRIRSIYTVTGQYSLERNDLLEERLNAADKPLIDRLFPSVRLSTFSTSGSRDTRDDPIDPDGGSLLGLNGDLALRAVGSQIGFAKSFIQAFVYRRLPARRRIVFAAGARLGLGTGFPRQAPELDAAGNPVLAPDGTPVMTTIRDLPASERFFAGGDTTVRGFQLDHLGTPATFDSDGQPIGGHALLVLNGELRVAVWRDLGVVGFLDVGNVFDRVNNFSLGELRAGAGFGIRYKSPVGPIRVDIGFKLGHLLTFGATSESRTALHISIGQAF